MFLKRNPTSILSLDGEWKFRTDEDRRGKKIGFMRPGLKDADWSSMKIPVNWHLDQLKDYSGVVWFRKRFPKPKTKLSKVTLRFSGVDYYADVWLNGKYLGSHEGYFAPFEFEVTDLLKDENLLVVEVDSPWEKKGIWPNRKTLVKGIYGHHDCRPGSISLEEGQKGNTGGIWNSVQLIFTGPIKIDKVLVHQKFLPSKTVVLRPKIYLRNLEPTKLETDISLEIGGANFKTKPIRLKRRVKLAAGQNDLTLTRTLKKPKLWWPWDCGPQNLYSVKVGISVNGKSSDEVKSRFGVRKVEVDRKGYWHINGMRFFLRGTNTIHAQWLSEMNREKYERDLKLVKDCNINTTRVHAHVEREELYEVADEMGILIWQDFALQWSYDNGDWFVKKTVPILKDMIHTFFNYPSIVAWCCHNEPTFNLDRLDKVLYRVAKKLDKTRYVHLASEFKEHPYPGWYYGHFYMYAGIPGGPFPTEFGAPALMNLESMKKTFKQKDLWPPNWSKWAFHDFQYEETFHVAKINMGKSIKEFIENSQDYQAKLLKFAVESYRRRKYTGITGTFQFMFMDCWPSITWSVVDYFRKPKKGYFTLQKVYSPFYMILTPPREEFSQGSNFFGDFAIINDLHKEFKKAVYRWWVETPSGKIFFQRKGTIDIPADGVKTIYPFIPMEVVRFPMNAETGTWKIKGTIKHGGKIIAENEETFQLVPRPQKA